MLLLVGDASIRGWAWSAARAQARICLEGIEQLHEIVEANDPLELEAGPALVRPDQVRFDPAHDRQADDDALSPLEAVIAHGHESMGGQIDDVDMDVAQPPVLGDHLVVDRMPGSPAQIGN